MSSCLLNNTGQLQEWGGLGVTLPKIPIYFSPGLREVSGIVCS